MKHTRLSSTAGLGPIKKVPGFPLTPTFAAEGTPLELATVQPVLTRRGVRHLQVLTNAH